MADNGRSLLFLSRPRSEAARLASNLRLLCPVEEADPEALRASSPAPSAVVANNPCADDLEEHDRWQIALLPFRHQNIPVIALLDALTEDSRDKARGIGAAAVLPSDALMRDIAAAIRALVGTGEREATTLAGTVEQAVFGFADMMSALGRGARVQPDEADRLADILIRTVRTEGSDRMLRAIAAVHEPTYRHCMLMAGVTASFVVKHGLHEEEAELLTRGAVLHDVGKTLVRTELLDKPTALTEGELSEIRQHAPLGYDLLKSQDLFGPAILQIVRSHHECLDGTGYPDRLSGREIPDHVRLSTICDVFTALVEPRPYKRPLAPAKACDVMADMGAKLDIAFLAAFRAALVDP